MSVRLGLLSAAALLVVPAAALADPADAIAAAIDRHLAADWQARPGLLPAPPRLVVPAAALPAPADAIAAAIDRPLAADWQARGIIPADRADDAEFVRRVYLDLIGRAPKAAETRDFLDDKAP